jgi:transposase
MSAANDMRSLPRQARRDRRVQVIRLRQSGYIYEDIAARTGLSRTGVFNICQRYQTSGAQALRDAAGGRQVGDKRRLSAAQEAQARRWIAQKTPDRLKLDDALWTRAAVTALIRDRYGIELPIRTLGLYLQRWGIRPHQPATKADAIAASPAIKKWLSQQYPVLAARAKAEGAEIHWVAITRLHSDDVRARSPVPGGRGQRPALSLIASVTNKGTLRWQAFEGALSADILIDFMQRLIQSAKRKVCLILGEPRVHSGKPVQAWASERPHAIELVHLPSGSSGVHADAAAQIQRDRTPEIQVDSHRFSVIQERQVL